MRILFFGDLAPTGFGTVTMDLGRAMLDLGHDLRFVSQNEVGELPEPFASRTFSIDPSMTDPNLANDVEGTAGLGHTSLSLLDTGIVGLLDGRLWNGWTPEACIILGDFASVRLMVLRSDETKAAFGLVPTYHYVPIEGVDLPPRLGELWTHLQPVAMSEFGADELAKVTGTRPPVVVHGVDTAAFRPASPINPIRVRGRVIRSKADAKAAIGADPKARIILRTDRNMPRKRYPEFLRAMAPVLAARGDTFLVIHNLAQDQGGDLRDTLSKWPTALRSKVVLTDGRCSRDDLVVLYNAADLYVSNSAEGFGLTIAEAMACGTPAVGLDYSAVPEVIGPGGVLAPVASLVDNEYDYFWAAVDQRALAKLVGDLIDDHAKRQELGRIARDHIVRSFQWTQAARQMADVLSVPLEVAA